MFTWKVCRQATLIVLIGAMRASAASADGTALLKTLTSKYAAAKNVTVRFVEGEGQARLRGTATVEGTNKYRIDLSDRSIVCNGKTVWNYSPRDNRVTIDTYRPNRKTLSPEFFITRLPSDAKAALAEGKDGKRKLLTLEPPEADAWGVITRLIVETDSDGSQIYSVTIFDASAGQRTVHIQSTKFDQKIPASTFEQDIPKGATVMDLR